MQSHATDAALSARLALASERDLKSQRFNNLQVGDRVKIARNNRPGYHDVTRRADLDNQVGLDFCHFMV